MRNDCLLMLSKQGLFLLLSLDSLYIHILIFCVTVVYLQNGAKRLKRSDAQEPVVSSVELDSATQQFSLGTPRLRRDFQEPSTPEMPDLSSVTQDICKVSPSRSQRHDVFVA